MQHFPIFVDTRGQRVTVSGGGEAAVAKLRLLLKTEARVFVFAAVASEDVQNWANDGKLTLIPRALEPGDAMCARLFYAANDDDAEDARVAKLAKADGALVNLVDNLGDSEFITPAIVDRDPVTVAIGTEGAAPVLARRIKADLEERLPSALGIFARIGKTFRHRVEALPFGRKRRAFWSDYYERVAPKAFEAEGEAALELALEDLLGRHLISREEDGRVEFVGAGPGDPDLLTLRARNVLHEADVVIYDRLVPSEILELARREATLIEMGKTPYGASTPQEDINAAIVAHGAKGAHVVRLKSGDATVFGRLDEEIEAVEAAGLAYSVVPGITAASAAVAAIGQSLTKRGRNSSVRLMTGHDTRGFADHDWAALARPGEVAAIYMGKKSARFFQGRMLMHGADAATPVTIVENASRTNQTILSTTLGSLEPTLTNADLKGPALVLFGLAPRAALDVVDDLDQREVV